MSPAFSQADTCRQPPRVGLSSRRRCSSAASAGTGPGLCRLPPHRVTSAGSTGERRSAAVQRALGPCRNKMLCTSGRFQSGAAVLQCAEHKSTGTHIHGTEVPLTSSWMSQGLPKAVASSLLRDTICNSMSMPDGLRKQQICGSCAHQCGEGDVIRLHACSLHVTEDLHCLIQAPPTFTPAQCQVVGRHSFQLCSSQGSASLVSSQRLNSTGGRAVSQAGQLREPWGPCSSHSNSSEVGCSKVSHGWRAPLDD